MKILTYTFLPLLGVGYLSFYINSGFFGIMGMIMPVIVIAVVILSIYWVALWRRLAIFTIAALLIGIGQVSLLFQMPSSNNKSLEGDIIEIMTFNAHYFKDVKGQDVLDKTVKAIDSIDADIVCLQEFTINDIDVDSLIAKRFKKYKYYHINISDNPFGSQQYKTVTLSKHRIISSSRIKGGDFILNSFYSLIEYKGDTIKVINSHLRSNQIGARDINLLMGEDGKYETKEDISHLKKMYNKLIGNNRVRAKQAKSVGKEIKTSIFPVISVGDYNSIPTSFVYNKMRGKLVDSFTECGSWYGYTYKSLYSLLRIDYIMHSKDFECVSYKSPNIFWSDHKPVIVKLKR